VARRYRFLIALTIVAACSSLLRAEEADEEAQKPAIEAPSPDGQFAFRYISGSDEEPKTFELIEKVSGKVVQTIAESNPDPGPSERFNMEVLWKSDSKAFAVTKTLWKRGSFVEVFMRDGATFRDIKVPELVADIPDKVKRGKSYHHVGQSNSESAKRWQKNGSLVVQIETTLNGDDTLTATRTVILGFHRSDQARVLKSTIKFTREKL
jgi:hypothetical protein